MRRAEARVVVVCFDDVTSWGPCDVRSSTFFVVGVDVYTFDWCCVRAADTGFGPNFETKINRKIYIRYYSAALAILKWELRQRVRLSRRQIYQNKFWHFTQKNTVRRTLNLPNDERDSKTYRIVYSKIDMTKNYRGIIVTCWTVLCVADGLVLFLFWKYRCCCGWSR